MADVNVPIFVESRYKVNRKRIKNTVASLLEKHSVVGKAEVSVAIVGDRKMRELSKKYKGEDKTRNVLSFSMAERADEQSEGARLRSDSGDRGGVLGVRGDTLLLGDIVLSYPEVIREASRDEVLVDDKVDELISHGLEHLLGLHHE